MLIQLRARMLAGALFIAVVSCANYQEEEVTPTDVTNRQRDVIMREEIQASPHRLVDLLQAVRALRPHFLKTPSGMRSRANATLVYIDGVRQQNGLSTLAGIPASAVDRVEYLDPIKAENAYGSVASGGAVLVTLSGQRGT